VSTLDEIIQLHQFQFNHIFIFSNHCYSWYTSIQLFMCIFVLKIRKNHTDTVQLVKLWQLLKNVFLSWKLL